MFWALQGNKPSDMSSLATTGIVYRNFAADSNMGSQSGAAKNLGIVWFDLWPNAMAVAALDTLDRNGQWRQVWPNASYAVT